MPSRLPPRSNLFISYSQADERLKEQLVSHFARHEPTGLIHSWFNRVLVPGVATGEEIGNALDSAGVVLLLVSADFLASDYLYGSEFKRVMERHRRGETLVIPIILRPCDWQDTPIRNLRVLPDNGKPVVEWDDIDAAFENVGQGIKQVISGTSAPWPHDLSAVSPKGILDQAIRAVPAVKYALGVAGIAAAVAIIAGFSIDYKVAVLGTIIMFALMFGLVVFSSFARNSPASLRPLALTLSWTFVILIASSSLFIFTGFFFSWPRSLGSYVEIPQPSPAPIQILITEIPTSGSGPESRVRIAGTVSGVRPEDYHVVIYSLTNMWYVQPDTENKKTEINSDGTWSADIYSGTRYAAILVPRDYNPPNTTNTLPTRMAGVVAATEVDSRR